MPPGTAGGGKRPSRRPLHFVSTTWWPTRLACTHFLFPLPSHDVADPFGMKMVREATGRGPRRHRLVHGHGFHRGGVWPCAMRASWDRVWQPRHRDACRLYRFPVAEVMAALERLQFVQREQCRRAAPQQETPPRTVAALHLSEREQPPLSAVKKRGTGGKCRAPPPLTARRRPEL